ncbi:phosphoribosylaminoimidazole synthetase [Rothia mucilaginosa DY-18]|uniref:Phosphoribosylaminoimidazole synthetase n=2 Tax=Rothia mucilaginosa TaxID=43675 RepID=D2NPX6_ROTMD|nr:phosphoribosylaminoimidazole synthetase [Rothia mucilaginosa DY-18]
MFGSMVNWSEEFYVMSGNTFEFLSSSEEKMKYMISKGYLEQIPELNKEDLEMFECTNFHHLLGYIRQYNRLIEAGKISGPFDLSQVLDIVRMDTRVTSLLQGYIREGEQAIRSAWIKAFCSGCDKYGREYSEYLNPDSYPGDERITRDMMAHILRYREPYVRKHIRRWWRQRVKANPSLKDERFTDLKNWNEADLRKKMQAELPLWSVVDSFSLGLLSRAVRRSRIPGVSDGHGRTNDSEICNETAKYMGILWGDEFQNRMKSFCVLRNRISHGSRLWMMPETVAPKKPEADIFEEALKNADLRGMLLGFANVALFQGSKDRRDDAWCRIHELVKENPVYYKFIGSELIPWNTSKK